MQGTTYSRPTFHTPPPHSPSIVPPTTLSSLSWHLLFRVPLMLLFDTALHELEPGSPCCCYSFYSALLLSIEIFEEKYTLVLGLDSRYVFLVGILFRRLFTSIATRKCRLNSDSILCVTLSSSDIGCNRYKTYDDGVDSPSCDSLRPSCHETSEPPITQRGTK